MHIIISPAKNLNIKFPETVKPVSFPSYLYDSKRLISSLKKYNTEGLMHLMNINFKLAELNKQRYKNWNKNHTTDNTGPAVFVFNGAVYQGLKAESLSNSDLKYAGEHLSILSGLYGILKPLDGIQAYRLEMGTKLSVGKFYNLYDFWGTKINKLLNARMEESKDDVLINLSSNEYFKSVIAKKLKCRIITPVFKDFKSGEYKLISVYFKKARGLMTRFILKNRLNDPEQIKAVDYEGYYYNDALSEGDKWVFTRD